MKSQPKEKNIVNVDEVVWHEKRKRKMTLCKLTGK